MKKNYLVTHGGITMDLSNVKAFHIDTWNPRGKSHILRIEFHSRYEYIFNPEKQEYEKVLINDFTEHPYAIMEPRKHIVMNGRKSGRIISRKEFNITGYFFHDLQNLLKISFFQEALSELVEEKEEYAVTITTLIVRLH